MEYTMSVRRTNEKTRLCSAKRRGEPGDPELTPHLHPPSLLQKAPAYHW